MLAMAHETRLDRRDAESGTTLRAVLTAKAAKGDQQAAADLEPPAYPETLGYLRDWTAELVGRSGVGMDGFAPLSWECLDAWARRMDHEPTADECWALMRLDLAMRKPDDVLAAEAPADEPKVAVVPAWPSKKETN